MSTNSVPNSLLRMRGTSFVVAGAGVGISVIVALVAKDSQLIFQAFLYAWILSFGLAMGSQGMLFMHHMTAGAWSFPIQRMLEASSRTIFVLGSIFLLGYVGTVAFGINHNYNVWIDSDNPIVQSKSWWLNLPFWTIRSVIYIVVAMGMARLFSNWSKKLDDTGDALITLKFRKAAPVCLLVYCAIMTFAPLDWVMSLEPEWFSTIYGPLFA
ncbi:MAG: hypothetical protein VCD00_16575, partial [Candidatus Hydrogenedentota bacterium]